MVPSALWLATGAMHHALTQADERGLVLFRVKPSKTLRLRWHYSGPKTHPKRICIANVHRLGRAILLVLLYRALRSFHVGSQGSCRYEHEQRRPSYVFERPPCRIGRRLGIAGSSHRYL